VDSLCTGSHSDNAVGAARHWQAVRHDDKTGWVTYNMATSTRLRKESPSREMEMQMRARPRDGQAEGVGKTADRGGNVPSLSSSGLLLALSRIKIRTI